LVTNKQSVSIGSSADGGKPVMNVRPIAFSYELGKDGVIKGLLEAIKEMKTGENRLLVIPPDLGYGVDSGY
jgi:FKBP-type peptidyl-prolyl cis-trans isomerase